jgi:hypothetical protein
MLITKLDDERLVDGDAVPARWVSLYRDSLRAALRDRNDIDKVANAAMDRENAALQRAEEAERKLCRAHEELGYGRKCICDDPGDHPCPVHTISPCRHESIVARIDVEGMAKVIYHHIHGGHIDDSAIFDMKKKMTAIARALCAYLKGEKG